MPPTFLFILALFAYAALAGCVLIVAAALAVVPKTRGVAKKLAAGIFGSFPGVFLFQVLAAPAVVLLLLLMFVSAAVVKPGGTAQGLVIVGFALVIFCLCGLASVAGFYTGFRAAWEFAAGRSPREFFTRDRLIGPVVRLVSRIPLVRRVL